MFWVIRVICVLRYDAVYSWSSYQCDNALGSYIGLGRPTKFDHKTHCAQKLSYNHSGLAIVASCCADVVGDVNTTTCIPITTGTPSSMPFPAPSAVPIPSPSAVPIPKPTHLPTIYTTGSPTSEKCQETADCSYGICTCKNNSDCLICVICLGAFI